MYSADNLYYAYRRARKKFTIKTYILLLIWLILGIAQWMMVCFVDAISSVFDRHYYICIATFLVAISLFALFLFFEKLRLNRIVAFVLAILIVELQIISLFILVARSYWVEVLVFFFICALLVIAFAIIGAVLPRRMDLTLHVALLFILAFIFLLVSIYFLLLHLLVYEINPYAYILVELPISLMILFFVMYHGQTIYGRRFAEMRLYDFLLGSLILFHDFLIIYWLTFYWQIRHKPITPSDFRSTTPMDTRALDLGDEVLGDVQNGRLLQRAPTVHWPTEVTLAPVTVITLDFEKNDMATKLVRNWPRLLSHMTSGHLDDDELPPDEFKPDNYPNPHGSRMDSTENNNLQNFDLNNDYSDDLQF